MKDALNFLVAFGGIVIIVFACVIIGGYVTSTTDKSTRDTVVIIYHEVPIMNDTTYDTIHVSKILLPNDTVYIPITSKSKTKQQ